MSPTSLLERQLKYILRCVAAFCFVGTIVPGVADHDSGLLSVPIVIHTILVWIGAGLAARSAVPFGGLLIFTGFELVRGCVVPVLVQMLGQGSPLYRQLGEFPDALVVLLLGNAYFAAVLSVMAIAAAVSRKPGAPTSGPESGGLRSVNGSLILISLGLLGLIVRFPSQEAVEGFIQGRYEDLQTASTGGVIGFASAVLRPLLPLGFVFWMLERRRMDITQIILLGAVLFSGYFALGSFGLNRATIIFPIVSLFIALAAWGSRFKASWVWLIGVGSLVAFFVLGTVRNTLYADRIGQTSQPASAWEGAIQTLLIYGQSPLQSAPAVAAANAANPWSFSSMLSSLVSPVPGVPDWIRSSSGTSIYNRVLYQNTTSRDQILPSWLEAHFSLGLVGLLALALVVALVFRRLDLMRAHSRSLLGTYAGSMATIWVAQAGINSISGVVQGLIYFALVPAMLSLLPVFRRRHQFAASYDVGEVHTR